MKTNSVLTLLALPLALATSTANATLIYGLTSGNQLVSFDSTNPALTTTIGTISQTGIVDIDFYPANGLLYGLTASGATYTINTSTAAATFLFNPGTPLNATVTRIDFNPQADRFRIFTTGGTNQNFRMVPDFTTAPSAGGVAGTLLFDGNFSVPTANLVGAAYNNNVDGAAVTALYSIDTTTDSLMIHSVGPQFDTITQIGTGLGIAVGNNVGFDIGLDGIAYLTDDNRFYTVNTNTGLATFAGLSSALDLTTIAASTVPEPSTIALGLIGAGAMVYALRRKKS